MEINKIYLQTHGGLGNQLFQYFSAKLIHNRNLDAKLILIHNDRYSHSFELIEELKELEFNSSRVNITKLESFITRMRVPKIFEKFRVNHGILYFSNAIYLDGYFQSAKVYSCYGSSEINTVVRDMARMMSITAKKEYEHLYHIRLADFFSNDYDRQSEITKVLRKIEKNSYVITSDDNLLKKPINQRVLAAKNCVHIVTTNMNPSDIFRLMTKARTVHSNNSTFAFWAALLSTGELDISSFRLKFLFDFIREN